MPSTTTVTTGDTWDLPFSLLYLCIKHSAWHIDVLNEYQLINQCI